MRKVRLKREMNTLCLPNFSYLFLATFNGGWENHIFTYSGLTCENCGSNYYAVFMVLTFCPYLVCNVLTLSYRWI